MSMSQSTMTRPIQLRDIQKTSEKSDTCDTNGFDSEWLKKYVIVYLPNDCVETIAKIHQ